LTRRKKNLALGLRNPSGRDFVPTQQRKRQTRNHLLGHRSVLLSAAAAQKFSRHCRNDHPQSVAPPLVTEKGVEKKITNARCASKWPWTPTRRNVKAAVQKLFKVKVAKCATANRKASCAAGAILRLPLGLEEGVRQAQAGEIRVRGD